METLKKLIECFVENEMNLTEDSDSHAVKYAKNGLKEDVIKEIETERGSLLKKNMQKEFEDEKRLERLKELKIIILEAIVLSFVIGMIVNQSTEIINLLNPKNQISITLVFIILFMLIAFFGYKIKIFQNLIHYLDKKRGE